MITSNYYRYNPVSKTWVACTEAEYHKRLNAPFSVGAFHRRCKLARVEQRVQYGTMEILKRLAVVRVEDGWAAVYVETRRVFSTTMYDSDWRKRVERWCDEAGIDVISWP